MASTTEKDEQDFTNLSLHAIKMSTILHSRYAKLAFALPPTSLSIWDHLIEDIESAKEDACGLCTPEDALEFVSRFFSSAVVQRVADNFAVLADSWLGLDYTLRYGEAYLARSIVDDMMDDHIVPSDSILHNFFGVCEGDISEMLQEKLAITIDNYVQGARLTSGLKKDSGKDVQGDLNDSGCPTPKKRGSKQRHNKSEGSCGIGAPGGGKTVEGGGLGGDEGRGSCISAKFFNHGVEVVEVLMPNFKIPEKGTKERQKILQERSSLFVMLASVLDSQIYDPHIMGSEQGKVFLYHGTRFSSLERFQAYGIVPRLRRNQFSLEPAFYATNSLRQAFGHTMHKHAINGLYPISVLVFQVSASILHGDASPFLGEKPFDVMWFPDGDAEWEQFCINNMKGLRISPHTADLVIGPICLPYPGNTRASPLKVDGVEITQVAFCSRRSREWLQSCAVKIFFEKREEP